MFVYSSTVRFGTVRTTNGITGLSESPGDPGVLGIKEVIQHRVSLVLSFGWGTQQNKKAERQERHCNE
jgi:hypothetical protein